MVDSDAEVVEFWFDYVSAFACLGFQLVQRLCVERGHRLECKPIFLPAILAANRQPGSVEIESKRSYVFKHALRVATRHGLEFGVPCRHPFPSLLALRVTALSSPLHRTELVQQLFAAAWKDGRDLADSTVVRDCVESVGDNASSLLSAANEENAKAILRANTEAALASGVFGVPTFCYGGQLFWGCDSIPHLAALFDGRDQLDRALLERWENLPRH